MEEEEEEEEAWKQRRSQAMDLSQAPGRRAPQTICGTARSRAAAPPPRTPLPRTARAQAAADG